MAASRLPYKPQISVALAELSFELTQPVALAAGLETSAIHAEVYVTHLIHFAQESGVRVNNLHLMSIVFCQFEIFRGVLID